MEPYEFVDIVVKAYINKKGIFKEYLNAENHLPDTNEKQKSLFIFYVIQLDYATKSQRLYKGAKRLFNEIPEFFTPKYILENKDNLKDYIHDYIAPRYINEAVKRYIINSEMLADYNNDPRNIFTNSKLATEALKKVKKFRGFGPKIGNFFVRTMINVFGYSYDDVENILPPVDIHDVKIAYLLGYTKSIKMNTKNIMYVKEMWSKACKKAEKSWLVFDKALWLLGSEGKPKTKSDILKLVEIDLY